MKSNELIGRYLLGIASDEEVHELEHSLQSDEDLQDVFLLQAELDAHLRQEAQLGSTENVQGTHVTQQPASNLWKWVSGISTLAATILLAVVVLNFPPQKTAMAYPSLGELSVDVPWTEQNIWRAAGHGELEVLSAKLQEGVPVDARLHDSLTPLHIAALFNQREAAERLLAEKADLTLTDGKGNTALHMAAFLGNTGVVHILLSADADPAVRNDLGFNSTDLVAVVWNAQLEEFYHKLEKELGMPIDLDKVRAERPKIHHLLSTVRRESEDATPTISVWQAAITGNTAAVEQHIVAGTELNGKEDFGGNTPLVFAAIFGHGEVAEMLIEAGVDLEVPNNTGGTSLHIASFFCRHDIVELLLKSGADHNRRNGQQLTPFEVVTIEWDEKMEGVYRHVYGSLNMEFDVGLTRQTRKRIADILKAHTVTADANSTAKFLGTDQGKGQE
jgi:ankyrin repeat protein